MHSFLLVLGGTIAILSRYYLSLRTPPSALPSSQSWPAQDWSRRWYWTLGQFLLPPLFLGAMAIAVLMMGHHGQMLGQSVSWVGCHTVLGLGAGALLLLGWQMGQSLRSLLQLRALPRHTVQGQTVRQIDTDIPFAGRIGLWNAELVLSQNLSAFLTADELKAVLQHEQAHLTYQDTFWFFWLGWVRRMAFWLPQTEALWQELLLLRELRADAVAAQSVDPLTLAEALLKMIRAASPAGAAPRLGGACFADDPSRLEQRIEALMAVQSSEGATQQPQGWNARLYFVVGLTTAGLPLLTNMLHSM